ncbi:hypothetical protein [Brevundimonas nasdae]
MQAFDPIPDRHPRLLAWAIAFRAAGYPAREVARLFQVELGSLVEAGMEP